MSSSGHSCPSEPDAVNIGRWWCGQQRWRCNLAALILAATNEENGRLITDAMTQKDIANMTGASREMVSRIFMDLKAGGYIALEGKRVVILRKLPARW